MKYLMIVLLLLSQPVWADDAGQRLTLALKQMDNLTTEFKQTLLDEDKNVVQQSRGTLALQRPGKFPGTIPIHSSNASSPMAVSCGYTMSNWIRLR